MTEQVEISAAEEAAMTEARAILEDEAKKFLEAAAALGYEPKKPTFELALDLRFGMTKEGRAKCAMCGKRRLTYRAMIGVRGSEYVQSLGGTASTCLECLGLRA